MTVVIVTGGEPLPHRFAGEIPAEAFVIAADSGLDTLLSWGLDADLVVGDLDSVGDDSLEVTAAAIERHSPDKDATDLELALQAAARLDPDRVVVLGGQGGRLDHLLATALLLVSDRWVGLDIEWVAAGARIRVLRGGLTLHGATGSLLTLLAVAEPATGVTTTGLRWNLDGDTLEPGSTRGVSNLFTAPVSTIRIESGVLVAIQPDPE
jgi:thiamine pyrophosphokinase